MIILRRITLYCLLMTGLFNALQGVEAWDRMKKMFDFGMQEQPRSIKVLIAPKVEAALLEVKGSYNIYNPMNGERLGTRFFRKSRLIQPKSGGLKWGEEFPDIYQISIVPDDPNVTTLVNGIEYRGTTTIYQVGGNSLSIVNDVGIEDYVKSVLAEQIEEPLARETMAALAIVSRTDAYFLASKKQDSFWQVSAEEVGYLGYGVTQRDNGVEEAVDATKHLIMNSVVDGGVQPFPARWTEHSAGRTAPFHILFRQNSSAPRRGVEAPFAAVDREVSAWKCDLNRQELASIAELEKITDIKLYQDRDSRKVYALRFEDGEQAVTIDFIAFQKAVGSERLKSSEFSVGIFGEEVTFQGYGTGHGVGLCLYSAQAMASRGDDAAKILGSFFPETAIELIPESAH